MSLQTINVAPGFMPYMPKEYRDLVLDGPYGRQMKVSEIGSFKEIIEEHPMCAGCGRLALTQGNIPFIYGNYCDTNAVASGLKRGLKIRFPEQTKDVVVMAGDGGLADIGFAQVMHSWFRKEKFTTIMLDNEVYGNTGGQDSGMTMKGMVLKMAPKGKQFEKMDMMGLAKTAGVVYIARLAPTNPTRVVNTVRKAILIAREVGPTFIQAYTSCNIEYAIPTPKVLDDARQVEKDRYGFTEYMTDEAKEYLASVEKQSKSAKTQEVAAE